MVVCKNIRVYFATRYFLLRHFRPFSSCYFCIWAMIFIQWSIFVHFATHISFYHLQWMCLELMSNNDTKNEII
jgi:hypothetical protein